MNELHFALGALALVLLVGVFAVSKWQERRALRHLQETLREGVGDALMQPRPPAPAPPEPNFAPSRIEPTFGPLPDTGVNPETVPPARPTVREAPVLHWVEDPLLDCVLELRCARAMDGVAVIDACAALARLRSPLPAHLVAWDGRTQQWVAPDRFGFYAEMLAAIQLANRRHTLTEIDASQFIAAVQQVAVALDADFDPPEVKRIVELAAELDRLCARFDVRIGLTLQALDGAWDSGRIHAAAADVGFEPTGDARWVRRDESGAQLFTVLCPAVPAARLVLELDVPLAPVSAQPLRMMFETASALAAVLGARIVDDNGQPVQPASVEAIERQLVALYADMRGAGVEPGSIRALRLFG